MPTGKRRHNKTSSSNSTESTSKKSRIETSQGVMPSSNDRMSQVSEAGNLKNMGNLFLNKSEYDNAIDYYSQALTLVPNDVDVLSNRGEAYRLTGNFDGALLDFEAALSLDSNHSLSLVRKSALFEMYNAWISFSNPSISNQNSNFSPVSHSMSSMQSTEIQHEKESKENKGENQKEEIEKIKKQIKINVEKKDFKSAIANLDKMLMKEPKNLFAIKRRYEIHIMQSEFDLAEKLLNEISCLKDKKSSQFFKSGKGYLYLARGELQKARTEFEQALRVNENHVRSYVGLGEAYMKEGNLKEAIFNFNVALSENHKKRIKLSEEDNAYKEEINKMGNILIARGNAYKQQNELDRALADFKKALEIKPNNAFLISKRAEIYSLKNEGELADKNHNTSLGSQAALLTFTPITSSYKNPSMPGGKGAPINVDENLQSSGQFSENLQQSPEVSEVNLGKLEEDLSAQTSPNFYNNGITNSSIASSQPLIKDKNADEKVSLPLNKNNNANPNNVLISTAPSASLFGRNKNNLTVDNKNSRAYINNFSIASFQAISNDSDYDSSEGGEIENDANPLSDFETFQSFQSQARQ